MSECHRNRHFLNFVVEDSNGKMEFRITFDSETLSYEFEDFKKEVTGYLTSVFDDEYVANYLKFEVERSHRVKLTDNYQK